MTTRGKIWLALGIGCGGLIVVSIAVAVLFFVLWFLPADEITARVTAAELVADYLANEVAADGRYKNHLAEITGAVGRVDIDPTGAQYVTLESGRGSWTVQCFAARDESYESFRTLRPAQRVTVRGRVEGKSGNVLVRDCAVISR